MKVDGFAPLNRAAVPVAAATVALGSLTLIRDQAIFVRLTLGRLFLTGAGPAGDPVAAAGLPSHGQGLPFDAAVSLLHHWSSFAGLVGLKALLAGLAVAVGLWSFRRRDGRELVLALLAPSVLLLARNLDCNPGLAGFLFMAIAGLAGTRLHTGGIGPIGYTAVTGPLLVVWAWFDTSWLAGLAVAMVWPAGLLPAAERRRRLSMAVALVVPAGVALLAAPSGSIRPEGLSLPAGLDLPLFGLLALLAGVQGARGALAGGGARLPGLMLLLGPLAVLAGLISIPVCIGLLLPLAVRTAELAPLPTLSPVVGWGLLLLPAVMLPRAAAGVLVPGFGVVERLPAGLERYLQDGAPAGVIYSPDSGLAERVAGSHAPRIRALLDSARPWRYSGADRRRVALLDQPGRLAAGGDGIDLVLIAPLTGRQPEERLLAELTAARTIWRPIWFDRSAALFAATAGGMAGLAERDGYRIVSPSLFADPDRLRGATREEALSASLELVRWLRRMPGDRSGDRLAGWLAVRYVRDPGVIGPLLREADASGGRLSLAIGSAQVGAGLFDHARPHLERAAADLPGDGAVADARVDLDDPVRRRAALEVRLDTIRRDLRDLFRYDPSLVWTRTTIERLPEAVPGHDLFRLTGEAPGVSNRALLLVPPTASGAAAGRPPAILFIHGHHSSPESFVAGGVTGRLPEDTVVLLPEVRFSADLGVERLASLGAVADGWSIQALRLRDLSRWLGWLHDLEPGRVEGLAGVGRLGVAGWSMGGGLSLMLAAVDRRVEFAAACSYLAWYRDSALAINQTPDNYIPGILGIADLPEIAAAVAPRPLYVETGRLDPEFPAASAGSAIDHLTDVYRLLGVPERLGAVQHDGGHAWSGSGIRAWWDASVR